MSKDKKNKNSKIPPAHRHGRPKTGVHRLGDMYRTIIDNVTEGVSVVDTETMRFYYANSALCQMLGYESKELLGQPISIIHPKKEWPFLDAGFEAMACGEITFASRISCLTKDGKIIPADISSTRLTIRGKTRLLAFFTDVSKLKGGQHILRNSDKFLNLIMDQSFDGINVCQYDVRTNKRRLMLCNDRYVQMAGRTREELMAIDDLNTIVSVRSQDQIRQRQQFIKEQTSFRGRCSWLRPDGKENYYDWVAKPVKIAGRYYIVGVDRDVTEYVKAEEELKETEIKYKTLIEQIPAVTYTAALDKKSTTLYISPQVENILGLSPEQYRASSTLWIDKLHPDDRDRVLKELEKTHSRGIPFKCEYRMLAADNRVVWFRDEASIIKNQGGRKLVLQGVMFDITELKSAEQALRRIEDSLRKSKIELEERVKQRTDDLEQANKKLLAEIKTRRQAQMKLVIYQNQLRSLASELSLAEERTRRQIATNVHDHIGQNLAIAKIKLQMLADKAADSHAGLTIGEVRDIISAAIESTRNLTFEISPPVLYELGFEAAVEWLLRKARRQHNLKTDFQSDGLKKELDETICVFLFQTVRELLINIAKHAAAKSVCISVCRSNGEIQVSVADDGRGLNMKKLENLQTNPSGFGLFSIRERLSYIGGKLKIQTARNKGTEIIVTAPLAKKEKVKGFTK